MPAYNMESDLIFYYISIRNAKIKFSVIYSMFQILCSQLLQLWHQQIVGLVCLNCIFYASVMFVFKYALPYCKHMLLNQEKYLHLMQFHFIPEELFSVIISARIKERHKTTSPCALSYCPILISLTCWQRREWVLG